MFQKILLFTCLTSIYSSRAMGDPYQQTGPQSEWVQEAVTEFSPADSCLSVSVDQVPYLPVRSDIFAGLRASPVPDSDTLLNRSPDDGTEHSGDSDFEIEKKSITTAGYLKAAAQYAKRQRRKSTTYSFGVERIQDEGENKGSFKVMHGEGTVIFSPADVYCVDNHEQKCFLSVKQLEDWAMLFKTVQVCKQDLLAFYLQHNVSNSTVSQLEQVERFCKERDALLVKTFPDKQERQQYAQVPIRILFSFCTHSSSLSVYHEYTPVQTWKNFALHEDSQGRRVLILYARYPDDTPQRVPPKMPSTSAASSAAVSCLESPSTERRSTSPTKCMKLVRSGSENLQ